MRHLILLREETDRIVTFIHILPANILRCRSDDLVLCEQGLYQQATLR